MGFRNIHCTIMTSGNARMCLRCVKSRIVDGVSYVRIVCGVNVVV